jgi:hypothetical protein
MRWKGRWPSSEGGDLEVVVFRAFSADVVVDDERVWRRSRRSRVIGWGVVGLVGMVWRWCVGYRSVRCMLGVQCGCVIGSVGIVQYHRRQCSAHKIILKESAFTERSDILD